MELGSFKPFNELHQELINLVTEGIAISISTAQSRSQMSDLLQETQSQAEELAAGEEVLRQTNEELAAGQEELQQANEGLAERSEMLEKQQKEMQQKNINLEMAQKIIEEKASQLEISSKYKSEFLANMSHELRTPLNSLLILSKLLIENKEGDLTDKQLEYIHTIKTSGDDLLDLINDVLDLSKVEAGKMDLNLNEVELKEFPAKVKQQFEVQIKKKGLTLKTALSKSLPKSIRTDFQRVYQILNNLLSNALKFTGQGNIIFTIKRPPEHVDLSDIGLNPLKTLAFTVSDTGIGIPEDKHELVFKAFRQVDGSISRKYGGTGLGLSYFRELASLLGGEILLESSEGQGAAFTLYLPEKPLSGMQKKEPGTSLEAAVISEKAALEITQDYVKELMTDEF